jgi:hypothetical protein
MANKKKEPKKRRTKIVSVRFSEEQLEYIEYLIGLMEQATGLPTDRSKVIFKALDIGLESLEKKLEKIKM